MLMAARCAAYRSRSLSAGNDECSDGDRDIETTGRFIREDAKRTRSVGGHRARRLSSLDAPASPMVASCRGDTGARALRAQRCQWTMGDGRNLRGPASRQCARVSPAVSHPAAEETRSGVTRLKRLGGFAAGVLATAAAAWLTGAGDAAYQWVFPRHATVAATEVRLFRTTEQLTGRSLLRVSGHARGGLFRQPVNRRQRAPTRSAPMLCRTLNLRPLLRVFVPRT